MVRAWGGCCAAAVAATSRARCPTGLRPSTARRSRSPTRRAGRDVAEGTTEGVQGPKGTGGLAPQAAVSSGQSPAVDFESIIAGYKADQLTRRANWEIVSEEPVEIDGAKEARMTEARYDEVTGSTTTPVRTIDLHVRTEDGMLYDFLVRGPEADFDKDRLREAIDTFQIK